MSHPWHDVPIGEEAPEEFTALIEIPKGSRVKYEGPGIWFDPEVGNDPRWQKRWKTTERVELRLTPTRIVLLRRWGARGQAAASVSARPGKRRPLAGAAFGGVSAFARGTC